MTSGQRANETGNRLERFVKQALEDKGYQEYSDEQTQKPKGEEQTMMTKTMTFLDELALLAREATVYLKRMNNAPLPTVREELPLAPSAPVAPEVPAVPAAAVPEAPAKRARRTKAEMVADAPVSEAPAPAPVAAPVVPEVPESKSLDAVRALGSQFIQRFQKETPDGMTRLCALLKKVTGKERLSECTHPERLSLLAAFAAELAKADAKVGA